MTQFSKRLNRKIALFEVSENATQIPKEKVFAEMKKEIEKSVATSPIVEDKSLKIKIWLKEHDLFKASSMCDRIGINKGNFSSILNSEAPIPQKFIPKIEEILKNYGY